MPHILKNSRGLQAEQPHLIPGKVMEQIHSEVISKLMKDRKVIVSGQYRFTNSKSRLTSLIPFCDEVTGAMHKGRAVD